MSKEKNQLEVYKEIDEIISKGSTGVLSDSNIPVQEGAKNEKGEALEPIEIKYDAQADIKKFGLNPTEVVEYRDVFTGTMKKLVIDRRGTTDEKLALTLLDDKMNREQKDTILSMYLFEKGKQGSSMLMDLWAYKGQHTKESRAFQSTMRFDFELFLSTFQIFMQDSSDLIFNNLPIEVVEVEYEDEETGEKKQKEIVKTTREVTTEEIAVTLGEYARYHRQTSQLLNKRIRAEVEKREKAKGKGIYIGLDNKPYSVHEDGDIVEVVTKDREEVTSERGRDKEMRHMNENDGKSYVNDPRPCSKEGCANTGAPYCYEHDM